MTAPLATVRATLAHHVLQTANLPPLGDIHLYPHQQDAVHRIRTALETDHLALLADDVGMGKTFVALAVARHYHTVHVIAPASLLGTWCTALARTATHHARLWSLHRFSRNTPPTLRITARTLIIIDEAHHLRTAHTRRFRTIADVVSGCDVLLLSATPIHNRARDLRTLLSLRLGERADALAPPVLSRIIVRRTTHGPRPALRDHAPHHLPLDPAVLNALLTLPAPLPARDGAVAGALIRLGLLRAWCSSDAALAHALTQRLLRGEALRQALMAGKHPTRAELRTWLVGEQDVQLAFPELMATHAPEDGSVLDVLERHLAALKALRHHHGHAEQGDPARAAALRAILAQHPARPVVAFTQYTQTVRMLARALADIAGVGALTGRRAWIASGPLPRAEALALFAPVAQGRAPPPDHQRIRLLLTTDLLAEGVNLQDASVVVHLDHPWTAALAAQRVGRCQRIGAAHDTVHVHRLQVPEAVEAVTRLEARLRRKQRLTRQLLGAEDTPRHTRPAIAVEAASTLREILRPWLLDATPHRPSSTDPTANHDETPPVALGTASRDAWLAVLRDPEGRIVLLGGMPRRQTARAHDTPSGWRVSTRATTLVALLQAAAEATDRPAPSARRTARAVARVLRQVTAYVRRCALRETVGEPRAARAAIWRQARARVLHTMRQQHAAQRVTVQAAAHAAIQMLAQARGAGVDHALRRWVALAESHPPEAWLTAWGAWPVLARSAAMGRPASGTEGGDWDTLAVLILVRRRASFGG